MGLEIKDAEPTPEVPKKKTVVIDGEEIGDITPELIRNRIRWHSCLNMKMGTVYLIQGDGNSPQAAIADGMIRARYEHAARAEKLAWLESAIGTAGKSEQELSIQ